MVPPTWPLEIRRRLLLMAETVKFRPAPCADGGGIAIKFSSKRIHRQIIAIQEQEPAPLSQHVEGVPERLEEIVAKCLAKDKNERYQTARDLLIDLRNLRRKLDVDAEIERTVASALRSTSGGALGVSTGSFARRPTIC